VSPDEEASSRSPLVERQERRLISCAFVAAMAILAWTRDGIAGPPARLAVTRDPYAGECPDASRLAERVERAAGRSIATPSAPSASIQVTVSIARRDDGAYHATLQLTGD
jgi:hypothetical protein